MKIKIYGTASEIYNIYNLKEMLEDDIEVFLTHNGVSYFALRYNKETEKYQCQFLPTGKCVEYSTFFKLENVVYPVILHFL